jgi:hypothetical protein
MNRRDAIKSSAFMAGAVLAGPSLLSMLQSCKAIDRLHWQPLFLDEDEASFVSAFADTLLPATDTPGALDVKADVFVDLVFAHTYDDEAQHEVRTEIERFNAESREKYGDVFARLSSENRRRCLLDHENRSGKFRKGVWGTAVGEEEQPPGFYRSLKSLTLWAYFSSEEVGRNILNYDPIPGEYQGCIPLSEVGNSWTL